MLSPSPNNKIERLDHNFSDDKIPLRRGESSSLAAAIRRSRRGGKEGKGRQERRKKGEENME